jgi:flagellar motor switch protein FliN
MDTLEQQLISAFAESWNSMASTLLARPSSLKLLALREVTGDGMASALAVATTWSSAFAVPCSGALSGLVICLFKSEEVEEMERITKQQGDGAPKPGSRTLVNQTLSHAAAALSETTAVAFGSSTFIDLALDETRLSTISGDTAWVGTFMLTIGDDIDTQALMLYAPQGSLESTTAQTSDGSSANHQPASASTARNNQSDSAAHAAPTRHSTAGKREETLPKNIDRLLDVELDVVVRFGMTNMPLRDVVRMGVGTMIELNRGIDEPVELLVNGRPLARGEVVVVDGYYGVRITEIGAPAERALSIL